MMSRANQQHQVNSPIHFPTTDWMVIYSVHSAFQFLSNWAPHSREPLLFMLKRFMILLD